MKRLRRIPSKPFSVGKGRLRAGCSLSGRITNKQKVMQVPGQDLGIDLLLKSTLASETVGEGRFRPGQIRSTPRREAI
jgi:hypothetical protein